MGCRIGMTTNLEARKGVWESKCKCFKDWQVLEGPIKDRDEAQKRETALAKQYGCDHSGGGDDPDDESKPWYIYGFNHCGCSK